MARTHLFVHAVARYRDWFGTIVASHVSLTCLSVFLSVSSLYPSCNWDDKAIRRLIGDGKLAARLKGTDDDTIVGTCECPICFFNYSQVNQTSCCQAYICTECFLQVRPQKEKSSSSAACPFCNSPKWTVTVALTKDIETSQTQRQQEETEYYMAEVRARNSAKANNNNNNNNHANDSISEQAPPSITPGGFGSSLEQDRLQLLRARSSSVTSNHSESNTTTSTSNHPDGCPRTPSTTTTTTSDIAALCLTPQERQMIEEEMRAQQLHPLSQRLQAEQDQRRLQNELEYHTSRLSSRRGMANLRHQHDLIMESFRQQLLRDSVEDAEGGGSATTTLDDLVVLRAAIWSNDDDAQQQRRRRRGTNDNDTPVVASGLDGRLATLIPPTSQLRSYLLDHPPEQPQPHAQSSRSSGYRNRRRRNGTDTSGSSSSSRTPRFTLASSETAMDTAALLMRGVSEEEQLAMAIAASLAEQPSGQPQQEPEGETIETGNETTETAASNETHDAEADGAGDAAPLGDSGENEPTAPPTATTEVRVASNENEAESNVETTPAAESATSANNDTEPEHDAASTRPLAEDDVPETTVLVSTVEIRDETTDNSNDALDATASEELAADVQEEVVPAVETEPPQEDAVTTMEDEDLTEKELSKTLETDASVSVNENEEEETAVVTNVAAN